MNRGAFLTALFVGAFILLSGGVSAAEKQGTGASVQVSSASFQEGQAIPRKYTCDGANVSPLLTWSGAPANTKSWALICEDPDAPMRTFTHWIVYGIPTSATELAEGVSATETLANGGRQGMSDFKRVGYGGPCPPPGKPHRYFFKVYALDTELTLKPGATKKDLLKAMDKHILAEGVLMGTYQRSR